MIKTVIRIIKKFDRILNKHQKFRVFELLFIMLIGGLMEMLSVSLVIPFVEAMLYPAQLMENEIAQRIMGMLGINHYKSFLVSISIGLALLFVLKNVFLIFQLTIQEKFVRGNQFMTQKKLMASILSRPYEFFLGIQSGEVLRIVSEDTDKTFNCLSMVLSLFADLIIAIILIATILVISPIITIAISVVLLLVSFIIYKSTRRSLRTNGIKEMNASTAMNQTVLQMVQGIKEIKLMRKEAFFQSVYDKYGNIAVRTKYIGQMLSLIPRYMLEAAAMCCFFIIVAIMILLDIEIEKIIPILSGVAMAAVRLLPAVNRISNAVSRLTYYEPAVDKTIETLSSMVGIQKQQGKMNDSEKKASSFQRVELLRNSIEVKDISYVYPSGETSILKDANMIIYKGQSVGIVGSSGAGKTTAVDLILGLLKPQQGQVLVDGNDISLDKNGWLSQLAYIPQTIFMMDGSIRENVAFGIDSEEIDDQRVWKALKEASLDDYVRGLSEGLDTQIGERGIRLSGGQRQRIGIARALYTDPEILFLDEATSALDAETETAIMESIASLQGKITMVIIAHRLTTIAGCDVIYRVIDGKIVRER